ncbi:hypothetical protein [Desulfobacter curvatus]|uniref:hypothetical protein n=1 Tax=Desulfobacter curvatus TaxID=2290 RepID=UPI00036BD7B8|nr:hypothetical protein [Desulfobacter curvatus]
MKRKDSRYESSRSFSDEKGFNGYRERKVTTPSGIVEHTLLHTDRLDLMAADYYKQDRRWWRILDANPDFLYGFDMPGPGISNGDSDENLSIHGDCIAVPAARESER